MTKFFFAPFIIALAPFGIWQGGAYSLIGVYLVFLLMPLFDMLLGKEVRLLRIKSDKPAKQILLLGLLPYFYLPIHLCLLAAGFFVVGSNSYSIYEKWAAMSSVGLLNGAIGITYAHELGHRKNIFARLTAFCLLASQCYSHFTIEHNLGHHVRVATAKDPASAKSGQNLYSFILQSVWGGFQSAYYLHRKKVPFYQNCAVVSATLSLAITAAASYNGIEFGFYFIGQSLLAIFLLETVNYIQHYGLRRQQDEGGRFERLSVSHSWNSRYAAGNFVLLQLPRHADHHLHANKKFHELSSVSQAPQHPYGYASMILLAMVPPFWFAAIDPIVARVSK